MMPSDSSGRAPSTTAPGAWTALLLLLLINLFNYIDRQVLAAVEPYVREEFFPEVENPVTGKMEEPKDAKELMGWLNTAFLVTFMFFAPIFGALSTTMSRWILIAIGVVVWSLATGASGASELIGQQFGGLAFALFGYVLPAAYLVMLLTRCFVGIGEAVYGPIAPDIIADLFPVEKRGQVMALFYTAIPFGGALGYALGEIIASKDVLGWHWRYAFYIVVLPGILLGFWCLLMPEPRKQGLGGKPLLKPSWGDYAELFSVPSYLINCIGMTTMTFAMGGLAFWAPAYLIYRQAEPVFGIPPATFFGLLTALFGLAATIAGGLAGDWVRKFNSGGYFLVSGLAMCLGAPLLMATVYLPFPLAWFPLAGFVFCLFVNTGPTNTINANVIRSELRARGFAINILVIHLFGDATSPAIMGRITGSENRYDLAFLLVAAVCLIGGLVWLWGTMYLHRDTEIASGPQEAPSEAQEAPQPGH